MSIYTVASKHTKGHFIAEKYKRVPSFKLHFHQSIPPMQLCKSASDWRGAGNHFVKAFSVRPSHSYWFHLLTYSKVQSPSWEANWFAANQEIPRISRNPKVHYRTHKRPPPVSILGQPNPVHIPTSHLLEIRPNIIHPSTRRSSHWSPSLRFPHQDPIHSPLLTHTRHMPSPSHSSRFYHPHNIGWGVLSLASQKHRPSNTDFSRRNR